MITKFSHTTIWVLDQDEARDFYTEKLGFEVNTDERMDGFRWLTVSPPKQPDHELILLEPGPPMMDQETAEQVKALVAKGAIGPGAFETDDCHKTYTQLSERGVNFLSEPADRGDAARQLRQLVQHGSAQRRGVVSVGDSRCRV